MPARREREGLRIASVVDVAAELPIDATGIACRSVPMLDLMVPASRDLEAAVNAIEDLKVSRPTLVCCAPGIFAQRHGRGGVAGRQLEGASTQKGDSRGI